MPGVEPYRVCGGLREFIATNVVEGHEGIRAMSGTKKGNATTRAQLARVMSERQLQDAVVLLLQAKGYLVAHFRPAQTAKGWRTSMQGDPGFPDIVAVRWCIDSPRECGHVFFIELKSERGRLDVHQEQWLDALGGALMEVHHRVWRPSDWLDGTIERAVG
mgnify:FL=1